MNTKGEDAPGKTGENAEELVFGLIYLVAAEDDLKARGDKANDS